MWYMKEVALCGVLKKLVFMANFLRTDGCRGVFLPHSSMATLEKLFLSVDLDSHSPTARLS
jgi:hypothetical protein